MYTAPMAVYLFTYHAYRSWNADNPRGYVRQGQGILPPDPRQARSYDQAAKQAPVILSPEHQQVVLWILAEACQRRNWRLHQVACEPSHLHVLVSWHDFIPWQQVRGKLKNLMARELGRQFLRPVYRWFAKGASRKQVKKRSHFECLVQSYLPRHQGLVWREGDTLPWRPSATADG